MKESLKYIDYALFHRINQEWNIPVLNNLFRFIRDPFHLQIFYLTLAFLLVIKYRIKGFWVVLFLAVTMGLSDLISSHFFKPFFHRLRPCVDGNWKCKVNDLVGGSHGYSFTSSHAANNMSVCLFLSMLFLPIIGRWSYVFLILPIMVGYSQIYVGVHYPFDVLGGFITGSFCGVIMFWLYEKYLPQSQKLNRA